MVLTFCSFLPEQTHATGADDLQTGDDGASRPFHFLFASEYVVQEAWVVGRATIWLRVVCFHYMEQRCLKMGPVFSWQLQMTRACLVHGVIVTMHLLQDSVADLRCLPFRGAEPIPWVFSWALAFWRVLISLGYTPYRPISARRPFRDGLTYSPMHRAMLLGCRFTVLLGGGRERGRPEQGDEPRRGLT